MADGDLSVTSDAHEQLGSGQLTVDISAVISAVVVRRRQSEPGQ